MMSQSWVGKTIGGRYQIEALLGKGGMSAVYKAMDPNLRRPVAIKLIHPHLSDDPDFISRFKEEAAAVARLRHPNIIQVHDFNQDEGTYYLVMDYLVGETLQSRLKRLNDSGRQMLFPEAISICAQICEAAGYAHEHELIHRDIKPANIMLDVHGQAILMDFGIVKIIGGEHHTGTGATLGTAMYMSPEQIRSKRVDERSDIYSLGVTLYEMLSGRPPYQADSAITLMMMVLNDPLPELHTIRPEIPDRLAAIVYKALAKERTERYASMREMADALHQVQSELAAKSLEATAVAKAQEAEHTALQPPSEAQETIQQEVEQPAQDLTARAEQPEMPQAEAVEPPAKETVLAKPETPAKPATVAEAEVAPTKEKVLAEAEVPPAKETVVAKPETPVKPATVAESVPPAGAKKAAPARAKPAAGKKRNPKRMLLYAAGILILLAGITTVVILLTSSGTPAGQLAGAATSTRPAAFTVTPVPTNPPDQTDRPFITNTPRAAFTIPALSPTAVTFLPGEPVKIGYLLWVTDPAGVDALRGVEIALDNSDWNIRGHPIELVGYNEECVPVPAEQGAMELIQDASVIGIIGPNCSESALRVAPIISEAMRVMISPGVTNPLLTAGEMHAPGIFRTAPNDLVQVFASAQFAYKGVGSRRLAIIFTAGDPNQGLQAEAMCAEFTALGGECVMQLPIEPENYAMQPVINALVEARADVVYYMVFQNEQVAHFITSLREAQDLRNMLIILNENFFNPTFLEAAGENAVGVFVSHTSLEFEPTDGYGAFLEIYRNRYGQEPIAQFHAYAYDATRLLIRAMERVAVQADDGTLYIDPLAVREVLMDPDGLPGLTGLLVCSPEGDCATNPHGLVFEFISGNPESFRPGPGGEEGFNPVMVWP